MIALRYMRPRQTRFRPLNIVPSACPAYEKLYDILLELLTVKFLSLRLLLFVNFSLPVLNWPKNPNLPLRLHHALWKKFRADEFYFKATYSTVKFMIKKRIIYLLIVGAGYSRGHLKPFWFHTREPRGPTQAFTSSS